MIILFLIIFGAPKHETVNETGMETIISHEQLKTHLIWIVVLWIVVIFKMLDILVNTVFKYLEDKVKKGGHALQKPDVWSPCL